MVNESMKFDDFFYLLLIASKDTWALKRRQWARKICPEDVAKEMEAFEKWFEKKKTWK